MNVNYYNDPFPHLIIKEFYTDDMLKKIWSELDTLQTANLFKSETETGSAKENEILLKKNNGAFLYDLYENPEQSAIVNYTKSNMFNEGFMTFMTDQHWAFKYIKWSSRDGILVSYYETNDYYKSHVDESTMTLVVNLFKTPRSFIGGDLIFDEYDNYRVYLENNRAVVFPGVIKHAVTPISMNENHQPGYGRYAISQFFGYK